MQSDIGALRPHQGLVHHPLELSPLVRLRQEACQALALELNEQVLFAVPTGEHHWHGGVHLMHAEKGLAAIHVGHGEVHEYGAEVTVTQLEECEGLPSIRSLEDMEAQILGHAAGHSTRAGLIIHQQKQAVAPPPDGSRQFRALQIPAQRGQEEAEHRPPPRFALDFETPLVAAEDSEHGREAQAPPCELGGEEGIEDLLQHFRAHATARVAHFQTHVGARPQGQRGQEAVGVGAVDLLHSRADGDQAAGLLANGLGGIGHQVHDQLLHLGGVSRNEGQLRGQVKADSSLLGQGYREELGHLHYEAVQVHLHELQAPLARVGQQLTGEIRSPQAGLLDLHQEGLGGTFRWQVRGAQVGVAQDHREQVVEVVGDAP